MVVVIIGAGAAAAVVVVAATEVVAAALTVAAAEVAIVHASHGLLMLYIDTTHSCKVLRGLSTVSVVSQRDFSAGVPSCP